MTARVSFVDHVKRLGLALGWITLFAGVGLLGSLALYVAILPVAEESPWRLAADSGTQAAAFLAATWLVGGRLNRRSWDQMGWHRPRLGAPFGQGIMLGVLMAVIAVGLAFVASRASVRLTHDWSRYLAVAAPLLVGLLFAALFEELAFRGYPLRRLADAIGPEAATALLGIGFAAAHLGNPAAGAFGIVNIGLAAVWLSFAFFSPGGMPYAWGLHFGWNGALAALFDAPVSGYSFHVPVVEYTPGRRAWVDGGAFGPEGGLVATVVLVAGTLAVLGGRFSRPRAWLAG